MALERPGKLGDFFLSFVAHPVLDHGFDAVVAVLLSVNQKLVVQ